MKKIKISLADLENRKIARKEMRSIAGGVGYEVSCVCVVRRNSGSANAFCAPVGGEDLCATLGTVLSFDCNPCATYNGMRCMAEPEVC